MKISAQERESLISSMTKYDCVAMQDMFYKEDIQDIVNGFMSTLELYSNQKSIFDKEYNFSFAQYSKVISFLENKIDANIEDAKKLFSYRVSCNSVLAKHLGKEIEYEIGLVDILNQLLILEGLPIIEIHFLNDEFGNYAEILSYQDGEWVIADEL